MPIRRTKRWSTIRTQLRRNVRNTVARSAIIVQREVKMELSKPGTGRLYARNKGTRAMSSAPHGELTTAQVTRLLAKENARVAKSALRGKNVKMRSLRALGVHRASAPGQPPAVDTGHLRRSIQVDVSRLREANPRARAGTNVKYAAGLEYGMRRVAKRPYMRPAARKARPKIRDLFTARNLLANVK